MSSRFHELTVSKAFGLGLLKGEPGEGGILKQALTNMFPRVGRKG